MIYTYVFNAHQSCLEIIKFLVVHTNFFKSMHKNYLPSTIYFLLNKNILPLTIYFPQQVHTLLSTIYFLKHKSITHKWKWKKYYFIMCKIKKVLTQVYAFHYEFSILRIFSILNSRFLELQSPNFSILRILWISNNALFNP